MPARKNSNIPNAPKAPLPFNLPSRKKESGGNDPHVKLVPLNGPTWGHSPQERQDNNSTTIAALSKHVAAPTSQKIEAARIAAEEAKKAEEEAERALQQAAALAAAAKERAEQASKARQQPQHQRLPNTEMSNESESFNNDARLLIDSNNDTLLPDLPPTRPPPLVAAVAGLSSEACENMLESKEEPDWLVRFKDEGRAIVDESDVLGAGSVANDSIWGALDTGNDPPTLDKKVGLPAPMKAPGARGSHNGPSLVERIDLIRQELQLEMGSPMMMAVKEANEIMGLVGRGSLPDQVAALMEAMGLEDVETQAPAGDCVVSHQEQIRVMQSLEDSHSDKPRALRETTPPTVQTQAKNRATTALDFALMEPGQKAAHYAAVRARIMGTSGARDTGSGKIVRKRGKTGESNNWRAKGQKPESIRVRGVEVIQGNEGLKGEVADEEMKVVRSRGGRRHGGRGKGSKPPREVD